MMEPKLLPGGIVKLWGKGFFWKPCDIGEAKEEQKNRRILNYQGSQGVFLIFLLVTGHWLLPSPRWGFLEQSKADQFSALLRLNTLALGSTAGFPVNHGPWQWQVKRRVRWIQWFLVARDLYPPKVVTCFTWKNRTFSGISEIFRLWKPSFLGNDHVKLGECINGSMPQL